MKKTHYSISHIMAVLIITALSFILPLTAIAAVGTANVSYNNNTKTVTIIADVSDRAGDAVIITISKDSENTIINAIRTGADGSVNHTETMPESFEGGRYDVQVSSITDTATGYFIYPVDSTIVSVLPILNSKTTASALCDAVVGSAGELAVDLLVFEPVKSDASEVLFALRPASGWQSASGFLNSYNNALAAVDLQNGIAPATVFSNYGAALDIDVTVYNGLTSEEKGIFDGILLNADYTAKDVKTIFNEGKALSQLRAADNWGDMRDKAELSDNSTALAFDKTTYYSKLTNKDKAYQEFYAVFGGTDTIEQLRTKFFNASKKCYDEENKPVKTPVSSSPSGSGFGGSVSYTPPAQEQTPDPDTSKSFTDVSGHWAEANIKSLASKGIINGFEDGSFKPDNAVTRAEFVTMVVKALGLTSTTDVNFTDVANGSWYEGHIKSAVAANLVSGMPDGSFAPNENIKRQDAILILYRGFENVLTSGNPVDFADKALISDYALKAAEALSASGIVNGDDTLSFNPHHSTTRAEVAALLERILSLGKE